MIFPYDDFTAPALSAEEEKNPFAKFYYVPPFTPPEEVTKAMVPGAAMDPKYSIGPGEIEKLFLPEGLPRKNGYCIRPDGLGYACCTITLPDFSDELSAMWRTWFPVNDVHYKTWLPGYHISHQNGITENIGWGVVNIQGKYATPHEKLGLSRPAKELDDSFISFSATSGSASLADGSGTPIYNTLVKCLKRRGDDIQEQIAVWFGVHLDGENVIPMPCDFTLEHVRMFGCHSAWETYRKAMLWPEIQACGASMGLLPELKAE